MVKHRDSNAKVVVGLILLLGLSVLLMFVPGNQEYFAQPGRINTKIGNLVVVFLGLWVFAALGYPKKATSKDEKQSNYLFLILLVAAVVIYTGIVGSWSDGFYIKYPHTAYTERFAHFIFLIGAAILLAIRFARFIYKKKQGEIGDENRTIKKSSKRK